MDNCKNCFIPKNYPGVSIDETGVCNYCRNFIPPSPEETIKIRQSLEKELVVAANNLRKKKSKYHCVVALSGGKDSSYVTWLLAKKYKLNVLAITVDIGYLQEQAYKNISSLVDKLSVEHVFIKEHDLFNTVYKHGFTNGFFSKNEGLACGICCKLIPNAVLAYAIEHDIPWVALGKYHLKLPPLFLDTKKFILSPERFDPVMFKLFSEQKSLVTQENMPINEKRLPLFLNPMNTLVDYTAKKIYNDLEENTGIKKENFYSEKTTCMVSMATMYMYQKARGYNPYAGDVSNQIRNGIIEKDNNGLKDAVMNMANQPETKKLTIKVLKSIGVVSPKSK